MVEPDALLCSNTSTLPITELAGGHRPARRLHRPALLLARSTRCRSSRSSAASAPRTPTLAKAFDVTHRACKKTPIVVNDSRGFFTSRVIGTFINEGVAMLAEGIDPQTDRAGVLPGRLPGAGAAADGRADAHAAAQDPQGGPGRGRGRGRHLGTAPVRGRDRPAGRRVRPHRQVRRRRVLRLRGRQAGAAVAGPARPSSGATDHDVDLHELSERMLFVEAIETAEVLRRGRAHLGGRRQHRLDLRHRLPGRGRAAWCSTSRATRAGWPASWRGPTSSPRSTVLGSRCPIRCGLVRNHVFTRSLGAPYALPRALGPERCAGRAHGIARGAVMGQASAPRGR